MKPRFTLALFFVILTASLPALATTDGFYGLNKNSPTASWDGTTASRLDVATTDYDYAYGDESTVTYALPWPFTFYGQPYSQITADTNGNVWFGTTGSASSFNLASNGKGPVIAAWNNDLSSYFTGGVFVQHKTNPERIVIEWQTETYSDEGLALSNNFEVVLFQNGDIHVDYNSFTTANAKDFGSGISRNDAIHYLSLTNAFLPVHQLAGNSYTFSTQNIVLGVPDAPTGVTAIAGNGQATVNFNAPAANNGGTVSSYTVTSTLGNITATGTAGPIVVAGLTNGTAYTFTVIASNTLGTGSPSAPSNSATPASPPDAPTGVIATAGSNGRATVSFTAPASDGGGTILYYTVTSAPGNITATGTAGPIDVAGLTNGTAYTFTATATNAVGGTGPASAPSNSVTPYVPYSLALRVSGPGTLRSTPPPDISCTGVCNQSYPSGTAVTLTAIPDSGARLVGWTGACRGVGSCSVTMTQAQNVTAIFAANATPIQTTPSPIMGTYATTQNVTLTCSNISGSGCATTYYCLGDGCTPTTVYSGPISIASSTSLRFYSRDTSGNNEQVRTYAYTIDPTLAYSFERLQPQLTQPWYFNSPKGVAVDASGNVYVVDTENNRVQKFDANGGFVTSWGSTCGYNTLFCKPSGITVDLAGYVYVADSANNRIQKFDANGGFVGSLGSYGDGNGQFSSPQGITVDSAGYIYVADSGNHRIQKIDSTGTFIATWGSQGSDNGQFSYPEGITVDSGGNVYVADTRNDRIQKFDSSGAFVAAWGSWGYGGAGKFSNPQGIIVDSEGNVYVADAYNNRIQKFDSNGGFVTAWGPGAEAPDSFTPLKVSPWT